MKAVSLPTNTVVYILIAALVTAVIISLVIYFTSTRETIDYQAVYNTLCLKLLMGSDCATTDLAAIDITIQGKTVTLQEACSYLGMDDIVCRENCGCRMEE